MISRFNSHTQSNLNLKENSYATKKYRLNRENTEKAQSFKASVTMAKSILSSAKMFSTSALNALNLSPAIGACFVDFLFMVTPRTLTDFSRNVDAGVETGIRETSGTVNHASVGLVGLVAGWLVSKGFNKLTGSKVHLLFADNKALDVFGSFITRNKENNVIDSKAYFEDLFKNMRFLNTTTNEFRNAANGTKEAYTAMETSTAKQAAKILSEVNTGKYKVPKNIVQELKYLIIGEKGASEYVRLKNPNTGVVIKDTLENHINRAFSLRQAFIDKIKNDEKLLQKGQKILTDGEYLNKIKALKKHTAILGLAVPVLVGMSTQPINRYLTKKRTGSDNFVGVEGREANKTNSFKIAKAALGLGLGSLMISTILKRPMDLYKPSTFVKSIKEIGEALQYRGIVPTINQFKFIYGMTIMSRLLAVRDENEMRESTIKDTLGFANWLILGGFVSKIAAKLLNKDTLNYDDTNLDKSTLWNKIKNSAIFKGVEKSHEELLYPALKELNISLKDEKGNVRSFRKLMSELEKVKSNPAAKKVLKQLRAKNLQQLIGYIYSGVVLGYGIAKLNIAITNKVENKKKQNVEETKQISQSNLTPATISNNKTFSAFGSYLN